MNDCDVRLTVRVDIEDRNFHSETKRNGGADFHFSTNTHPLADRPGFSFTPAADRFFRALPAPARIITRPNGAKTSRIPSSKAAARPAAATPTAPAGLICRCRPARIFR